MAKAIQTRTGRNAEYAVRLKTPAEEKLAEQLLGIEARTFHHPNCVPIRVVGSWPEIETPQGIAVQVNERLNGAKPIAAEMVKSR